MDQNRKLKRRHLIFFLNVYEVDSGKLIGHLVDINKEGMMLVSEEVLTTDKDFHLKVRLPGEDEIPRFVKFKAHSIWSKNDINPVFYDTGFRFTEISVHDTLKIAEVIKEFGFND